MVFANASGLQTSDLLSYVKKVKSLRVQRITTDAIGSIATPPWMGC